MIFDVLKFILKTYGFDLQFDVSFETEMCIEMVSMHFKLFGLSVINGEGIDNGLML